MERLKEIPESRAVMKTVTEMKITETNLTTISPSDLELMPNLIKLDCSNNKLSRVAPYAFQRLSRLNQLDMSRNQVMHLSRERFMGLTSLQRLNLSRNHLISLDLFPADMSKLVSHTFSIVLFGWNLESEVQSRRDREEKLSGSL